MHWVKRDFLPPPPFVGLFLCSKDFRRAVLRCGFDEVPYFVRNSAARTWFLSRPGSELHCFVCVDRKKLKGYKDIEIYGLLVHEAVHIWQEWMKELGEDKPGDEHEAYVIQKIAGRLMERWKDGC